MFFLGGIKMKNLLLILLCAVCAGAFAEPYFRLDTGLEWDEALFPPNPDMNKIRIPTPEEIEDLNNLWQSPIVQGEPLVSDEFRIPPDLYVSPDVDYVTPDDQEGLVMAWGNQDDEGTEKYISSGWVLEYGVDPDLTNCTITLKVTPPSFITSVTFGLIDLEGDQISWTWNNLPNSPPNPMTLITINTNNIGLGLNAPSPAATGFAPNPNFDINKVQSFFINETFHTVPGVFNVPQPGGGGVISLGWNAWDEFEVKPNPQQGTVYKGYHVKYSQKPEEVEPGMIYGWDQISYFKYEPDIIGTVFMAADDWVCTDPRPVTDFHWWGSFKGWTEAQPPAIVPDYFLIGIWSDIPASAQNKYSRPGRLLWIHKCEKWVWNYAGIDIDPRCEYPQEEVDPAYYNFPGLNLPYCEQGETCFQFNQLLSEDEYFHQEEGENIYWLSIAAVYENIIDPAQIPHPWGWKTKPYDPDKAPDIAGIINDIDVWPPTPGTTNVTGFKPIILPNISTWEEQGIGEPFDLAFEITTNQKEPGKCYEDEGDINHDCIVDLFDFQLLAEDWLKVSIP